MTSTGAERAKILIVDDHPENVVSLAAILERPDYQLFTAHSGKQALQLMLQESFTVVLLDVLMPEMDGFEIARYLKQSKRTRRIPILFLTAVATDVQHIYRAYDVGAVDYLVKPLDPDIVRKKVAVFVELSRQREEIAQQAERLRDNQRREYELQLAELRIATDRRYHSLVEGIDHAIGWTADDKLQLTFVSRQAEKILGYSTGAFLEPDFWEERLHPDDREGVLATFRKVLADDPVRTDAIASHRLVAADGRVVWLHTGVSRATDERRRPEIHGISVDVTSIKRAEATQALLADTGSILSASLDYRAALQHLATRVVADLGDWCLIDERVETEGLVEVAAAHVDPDQEPLLRDLARPRKVDPVSAVGAGSVIRSGKAQLCARIPDEAWLADALGAQEPDALRVLGGLACMFVPLTARGRTVGVMTIVASRPHRRFVAGDVELAEEIGQRAGTAMDNARLYEEARSARHAREQLLAVVSHDLRNPLGAIFTSVAMIQSAEHGELVETHAGIISRSAQRMDRLIDDLLDVAQVQAGKLRVEREPCESATLVRECLESLRPMADERNVHLEAHVSEELRVSCDRGRVLQILANLVGNAVKFTPARGTVTVTASHQDREARFAVVDTGPGIPEDELPRVWDAYWQAATSSRQGVGLGLYIAKALVEAQGGRIWAESVTGVGTAFCFTLPLAAVDTESAENRSARLH